MGSEAATGGGLRDRFGPRNPAPAFGVLGVGLVGAAVAVPAFETLLFAWGGTALFAAVLLRFVTTTATVPAAVATDVHAVAAGNARRFAGTGPHRYVPDGDSVSLVVGGDASGDRPGTALDPVGERLLAPLAEPASEPTVENRVPVLLDAVVHDLELAAGARSRTTDTGVEVTVTGVQVGTAELFDHPAVSVVGVGLADALSAPVRVDPTVEDGRLVVACHWRE
ncbi:hypothetical protein NDI56_18495 [Haloarcula sp. S1CR25-12]|uniref:DUF7982 domain-containing protein n=1 Tax=Haloarcula saliterrae TaxID=2950534 RepID=A0ABU2FI68_9EURY|nr:hypothetical protein [Haloarcula sp. S1CR25-12]MDS0261395.1 hypothetical protein [Haloarcula sp. S1CR25-12]